jgi:phosphoglycerate kinase
MNPAAIDTIADIDVSGKRVLVRVDFDVSIQDGEVLDDTKIRAALPTITHLQQREARVLLMSHLGSPKGKVVPKLSLEPVAHRLAALLPEGEVILTDACVGDGAKRVALDLRDGQVALLENLQFHAGESRNDEKFARQLASLGDAYVNEAFSFLHFKHASIAGVPKYLQHRAQGLRLADELSAFSQILGNVAKPYVVILGGECAPLKINLLQVLFEKADIILLGGHIGTTFMAAKRLSMGKSSVEQSMLPLARDLMTKASHQGVKVLLPEDLVVADSLHSPAGDIVPNHEVPRDKYVVDIGTQTRRAFKEAISRAETILWDGAMGYFENEVFLEGTLIVARAIAGSPAMSVSGGEDTCNAVKKFDLEKGFNHISVGGESSLALLAGKTLPGLQVLEKK